MAVSNDTISEVHIHKLLDLVFQSMVLTVGLNDLVGQRNVERTKRDLRVRKTAYLQYHFLKPHKLIFRQGLVAKSQYKNITILLS